MHGLATRTRPLLWRRLVLAPGAFVHGSIVLGILTKGMLHFFESEIFAIPLGKSNSQDVIVNDILILHHIASQCYVLMRRSVLV